MKVLFLASEMAPFIKSGGLGDIIGSLPYALSKKDIEVSVFIPMYNSIRQDLIQDAEYICTTTVFVGNVTRTAIIYKVNYENINVYFISNEYYFNRFDIYGYDDDIERFSFFNRSAICALEIIGFKPDIIHLHDWQTAVSAIYLKEKYKDFGFYENIKTLFTIHNIQYQGIFSKYMYKYLGLNEKFFNSESIEYYGNINLLKTGIVYADAVSTVSNTYSHEIKTPQFGYGLDGVVRSRGNNVYGILNGIDYKELNQTANRLLPLPQHEDFFELKKQRKRELQRYFSLEERDVPIYAIISRFADQKGLELLNHYILNKDIQFIVLGTGEEKYERQFLNYQERYPEKFVACIQFDVELSYKIYAGSDFFIMPSLFEPCGLGQIFAMNFGTIPLVRKTGGLADTVQDFDFKTRLGNGLVFEEFTQISLNNAVDKSLEIYKNKELLRKLVQNTVACNFSWNKSADEYIELYKKIINTDSKTNDENFVPKLQSSSDLLVKI